MPTAKNIMKPRVSVIIPSYNAVRHLPLAILDVAHQLDSQDAPYEIIVIEGGSTDGSSEAMRRFSVLMPNVRVIGYDVNRGSVKAVQRGIWAARGKLRVVMKPEDSSWIGQLHEIEAHTEAGHHVIIGDSRPAHKAQQFSWFRSFGRGFKHRIKNLLYRINVHDQDPYGLFAFSAQAAETIFSHPFPEGDRNFSSEIIRRARRGGWEVKVLGMGGEIS